MIPLGMLHGFIRANLLNVEGHDVVLGWPVVWRLRLSVGLRTTPCRYVSLLSALEARSWIRQMAVSRRMSILSTALTDDRRPIGSACWCIGRKSLDWLLALAHSFV